MLGFAQENKLVYSHFVIRDFENSFSMGTSNVLHQAEVILQDMLNNVGCPTN